MSVNQSALSALQQSVTAANAEAGAKSALVTWKGMSISWDQETANAVGKASANYAIKWNDAVMAEIDAKIQKFQAEYNEKESQYEAVKSQYDAAEQAVSDAQRDMESCMGYEVNTYHGSGMFEGMQSAGGKSAAPRQKIIVDRLGYNEAKKREAQAKAEANRIKSQVDTAKRQLNTAESNLNKAQKEKEILAKKIEEFILNVYDLNLMDESVSFLTDVKNSSIELTNSTKNKLFSRLFFIQSKFRTQFEKFEELIKNAGETYKEQQFEKTPESLMYLCERRIKAKKFKGKIRAVLESKDISSAKLNYSAKNEFIIPKKKAADGEQKIQALCKNFVLGVDRSNFKIELNKNYENDGIAAELEQFDSHSEEFVSEYSSLLDEFLANGASNSKIRVLIGKLVNWHLNHWPKLWYKIVSVLTAVVVVLALAFGILVGIDTAVQNSKYKKSFVEWSITNDEETREFRGAAKRFKLEESAMRTVGIVAVDENQVQDKIQDYKSAFDSNPDQFIPFTEELNAWFKENISGILSGGKTVVAELFLRDSTGEISKRTGEKNSGRRYVGIFEITTAENGSIISITDLSGAGFQKTGRFYKYYH